MNGVGEPCAGESDARSKGGVGTDEPPTFVQYLQAEEADQQSDRGHASARMLRAIASLDRLLEGTPAPDQTPRAGTAEKP
jgi:hypothetical protein